MARQTACQFSSTSGGSHLLSATVARLGQFVHDERYQSELLGAIEYLKSQQNMVMATINCKNRLIGDFGGDSEHVLQGDPEPGGGAHRSAVCSKPLCVTGDHLFVISATCRLLSCSDASDCHRPFSTMCIAHCSDNFLAQGQRVSLHFI